MSDENVPAPVEPAAAPAAPPPATGPSYKPPRRRVGAVWWGVALVLFGGTLLVSQFVPGVELWRYWPLIIVALGVRGMFGTAGKPWSIRDLGEGFTGVAFGLVLLGQMLGYLSWNVWLNILQLWPLLLVSLGFEIIGKGLKSELVRAFGSLVIIGGLAYGALVMSPTDSWVTLGRPMGPSEEFRESAAHDSDVETGEARLEGGVGRFSVAAGDDLAEIRGWSPFEPVFRVDVAGDEAEVRAGLGEHSWGPFEGRAELDVVLDRDVVWDLDVSAGVTDFDVDLAELDLSALALDAGVSNGTLTLGTSDAGDASGPIPVRVQGGVSSLTIRIPEGDNARVIVRGGLVGVDTMGEWSSGHEGDDRAYESDGFDESGAYWDIRIDAGIGGVTVEYY